MKFNHALAASLLISFLISLIVFAEEGQKNKIEKYYYSEGIGFEEITYKFYQLFPEENTKKTVTFNFEEGMIAGLKSFGYIGLGLTFVTVVGFGITQVSKQKS